MCVCVCVCVCIATVLIVTNSLCGFVANWMLNICDRAFIYILWWHRVVRAVRCPNSLPTIKHNQTYRYRTNQRRLIIISNQNGAKLDSHKKRISNALKLLRFRITIHTNLKIVNFLDVTLSLSKGTFEHYKKRKWHTNLHTHFFKPPNLNYQTNLKIY